MQIRRLGAESLRLLAQRVHRVLDLQLRLKVLPPLLLGLLELVQGGLLLLLVVVVNCLGFAVEAERTLHAALDDGALPVVDDLLLVCLAVEAVRLPV